MNPIFDSTSPLCFCLVKSLTFIHIEDNKSLYCKYKSDLHIIPVFFQTLHFTVTFHKSKAPSTSLWIISKVKKPKHFQHLQPPGWLQKSSWLLRFTFRLLKYFHGMPAICQTFLIKKKRTQTKELIWQKAIFWNWKVKLKTLCWYWIFFFLEYPLGGE